MLALKESSLFRIKLLISDSLLKNDVVSLTQL